MIQKFRMDFVLIVSITVIDSHKLQPFRPPLNDAALSTAFNAVAEFYTDRIPSSVSEQI